MAGLEGYIEISVCLPFLHIVNSHTFLLSVDTASKHALQGYFDSLRCELAPKGISVLVASPGHIRTQLSANAVSADGTKHGVMDPATSKGISPHRAAQVVVEGVACGRREVVPAKPIEQLAPYMRVLWPSLLDSILRWRESHT